MLNTNPYYHKVFKRAIIAFGSMFSDIKVVRTNADGSVSQTIAVPIAQSPKEKWIVRVDSDPELDNHTYTILPRMAFEITGVSYDSSRKLNRLNKVVCAGTNDTMTYAYAPVPYNIDISLYILTKTQEDAFQIVEQILPYFTPDFTLGVKSLDQLNVVTDIPVIINSVQQQDDYDGDFQTRRFITWTLNFTMKLNLFGPVNENGIITKTIVDVGDINNKSIDPAQQSLYTAEGNVTDQSVSTEKWTETTYGGDFAPPVNPSPDPINETLEVTDVVTIEIL